MNIASRKHASADNADFRCLEREHGATLDVSIRQKEESSDHTANFTCSVGSPMTWKISM
jgi:hypothetical protein